MDNFHTNERLSSPQTFGCCLSSTERTVAVPSYWLVVNADMSPRKLSIPRPGADCCGAIISVSALYDAGEGEVSQRVSYIGWCMFTPVLISITEVSRAFEIACKMIGSGPLLWHIQCMVIETSIVRICQLTVNRSRSLVLQNLFIECRIFDSITSSSSSATRLIYCSKFYTLSSSSYTLPKEQ